MTSHSTAFACRVHLGEGSRPWRFDTRGDRRSRTDAEAGMTSASSELNVVDPGIYGFVPSS